MAKSLREILAPILFLVVGAFWVGIVATGAGGLLLLAAAAFILSGIILLAMPEHWLGKPLAGASALLGLALTLYQAFEAATLLGSNLSTVGVSSFVVFGVLAVVCVYLEMATLSMGRPTEPSKRA